MKLLLDENLAPRLVRELTTFYPGSAHVDELGLRQSPDADIWEYAKNNDYTIVTKDDDFQQFSAVRGHPPKVVLFRTGNCSTSIVLQLLRIRETDLNEFYADDAASLLILR